MLRIQVPWIQAQRTLVGSDCPLYIVELDLSVSQVVVTLCLIDWVFCVERSPEFIGCLLKLLLLV